MIEFLINCDSKSYFNQNFTQLLQGENWLKILIEIWVSIVLVVLSPFNQKWLKFCILSQCWPNSEMNQNFLYEISFLTIFITNKKIIFFGDCFTIIIWSDTQTAAIGFFYSSGNMWIYRTNSLTLFFYRKMKAVTILALALIGE